MVKNIGRINLDNKDRKILLELDNDATQSLKQIARKLRASKEVVAYRIKQMEKSGIIRGYTAIYHPLKLGFYYFKLYVKFAHVTEEKWKEVIDFVKREKNFSWLATSEGSFDLMVGIHFPSVLDFDKYKNRLFSRFDRFFQKDSFAVLVDGEEYPRQYILGTKNPVRRVFQFCSASGKEKLDPEDFRIVQALSMNSRMPLSEIAKAAGLTDRVVRYRKRLLEKRGVIVGYKLFINYRKLNYILYKCLIKLQNADSKRFHDLLLYARQSPNVVYWQRVLGEWDVELDIEVPSIEEFYGIANDIRYRFSDIVQKFDTLLITEDIAVRHF